MNRSGESVYREIDISGIENRGKQPRSQEPGNEVGGKGNREWGIYKIGISKTENL